MVADLAELSWTPCADLFRHDPTGVVLPEGVVGRYSSGYGGQPLLKISW